MIDKDFDKCCDIIDIGDVDILCDCVRMLCVYSNVARDCLIGQYCDILDEND